MSYILDTIPKINMPLKAKNIAIEEILCNYTYGKNWSINYGEENCITIGNYKKAECGKSDFVVNITSEGVYISGCDYSATMRGFFSFLETLKYDETEGIFYAEEGTIANSPNIGFRCVHLCVFPETKLEFLRKCIRSCAITKYSHVILEFWGMFKYDCLKELSWPFAHSKDEIKKIVCEANALGLEVIPMFNHLGHASACRERNGKHVVLDQNPRYEYMFDSYGWVWNFKRDDVCKLLSQIRDELIEICGEGSYFHIGCDEAYAYGYDMNKAKEMAEYVNALSKELASKGRRTIMWHDLMMSKEEFHEYVAYANKDVSDILIKNLDKNIIIADWQYWLYDKSWKTSEKLKENGFDVVCCPWDNRNNISSAIDTVKSNKLYGIIHTTWHTLFYGFREMIYAGVLSYGTDKENLDDIYKFYCASVARKALNPNSDYKNCGWSEEMVGPGL